MKGKKNEGQKRTARRRFFLMSVRLSMAAAEGDFLPLVRRQEKRGSDYLWTIVPPSSVIVPLPVTVTPLSVTVTVPPAA